MPQRGPVGTPGADDGRHAPLGERDVDGHKQHLFDMGARRL